MENNNGRGIFYGVMGVATLVVAIVGATFAYFAASTSGNEGAVGATSANVAGTLKFAETPDVRTSLIPTTEDIMKQSFAQSGSGAEAKCKGVSAADGTSVYDLCSTYEFKLTNEATMAQTVYIKFKTVSNTFKNLYYCVYDGTTTANAVKTCRAVPASEEAVETVSIDAGGNHTYTVVLYVNETTADQTTDDSGKSFTGTVTASTSDGSNNVTGVIVSAG